MRQHHAREIPPTPLIGREPELLYWEGLLDRLPVGGGFVEVAGEPGIGKTRLLAEFVSRAARRGVRVLSGRATEFESDVPFQVYRDALGNRLDEAFGPLGPDSLPHRPAGSTELLDVERFRVCQAVGGLLQRLAEDEPTVLVLDDLHWADPRSVELTDHLIRHQLTGPFLLLAAHRPRQLPPRLLGTLANGLPGTGVHRLALPALTAEACAELAALVNPRANARDLFLQCGGNPLLLLALTDTDRPLGADGRFEQPTDRLLGELAGLGPDSALLAAAAAVLGDRFSVESLHAVSELPPDRVLTAAADLVRRDLLRAVPHTALFRLRHPLLSRTVYDHGDPVWRLGAHRRALAELTDRGALATELATHVERSLSGHDQAAANTLEQAALEVLHTLPQAAAGWLQAALRALPDHPGTGSQRLRLLLTCSQALHTCGRLTESRALIQQVLRQQPTGPDRARARAEVVTVCARTERMLGHYPEATAVIEAELAELTTGASPEAVELIREYGSTSILRGDYAHAIPVVESALTMAQDLGYAVGEAGLLALSGLGQAQLGATRRAVRELARSAARTDALPDAQLASSPETLTQLGWGELLTEHHPEARRHLERGLQLARQGGQGHLLPHLLLGHGFLQLWTGSAERAGRMAEEATEAARDLGNQDLLGLSLALEASCLVWTCGSAEAGRAVELASRAVDTGPYPSTWWSCVAAGVLAQTLLMAGEHSRCGRVLLEAGGGPDLPLVPAGNRASSYAILSAAALQAGNRTAAHGWATRAESAARAVALPSQFAYAERAQAAVFAAHANTEQAARLFDSAVDRFRASGLKGQWAWTLALGAPVQTANGQPERGAAWLHEAGELADETGARRIREQVDATAHTRSEPAPPAAPATPAAGLTALTTRERQITEILTTGARTKEIATALFLSPRTVETHLARIYRKLGVTSRLALVAALAAQPLDHPPLTVADPPA
ncbi:ATP-binding protein [Kitasatospora sp. NPDC101801]|uniref:ATP-binding protein n=1 Tax=Kitasatospora sp. NPDC101801 TaxID=3364103 RepID=UPI00381DAB52